MKIKSVLKSVWPIIVLLLLNIILFVANYSSGTFLTGWDNLHPELALGVNIQRSIFAVWQEYQSLGLLGGMGHASDLIRQIYLVLLSLILPLNLIRYVSTFTMLFAGGVGSYFLVKNVLKNSQLSELNCQLYAFIASLFYTLNIATIQTFYAPFEAFVVHFAALPWLLLSSVLFLEEKSKRNLVFLVVTLLLSTPSAYIPTLYVVYVLAISIYIFVNLILSSNRLVYFRQALRLGLIVFLVNAFWLLPFFYFSATNSGVNVSAKQNQMATETIFLRNKEFGTLTDTALLRGFWFNNVDPDLSGNQSFMLAPWRVQFNNPLVRIAGFGLFGIILVGAISILAKIRSKKNNRAVSFAVLFIFAFTMLATDTFPFSFFDEIFRKIPLFNQAFRFPFTKFNSLTALTYAVMLAFGISYLFEFLSKRLRIARFIPLAISALAILFIAYPVFQGHLLYVKERAHIPKEYFDTFEYFKKQDKSARIANLPAQNIWGWVYYRWGVGGSGFTWYGIKQPIIDRAFDVWSKNSENFYYQITDAIYSKDPEKLAFLLNKNKVSFILLDENVINPPSPRSLFYSETEEVLSKVRFVKLDATFGKIKIYKVDLFDKPNSFIFAAPSGLPVVKIPFWKSNDPAYTNLGNYISYQKEKGQSYVVFPFGSLFSSKDLPKKDFEVKDGKDLITIEAKIDLDHDSNLQIPAFLNSEKNIAVDIESTYDGTTTSISAVVKRLEVNVDGKKVWGQNIIIPLTSVINTAYPLIVNVNGGPKIVLKKQELGTKTIGTTYLSTVQDNAISIIDSNTSEFVTITPDVFRDVTSSSETIVPISTGEHTISFKIPKINDSYFSFNPLVSKAKINKCDSFRDGPTNILRDEGLSLTTVNTARCVSYLGKDLLHNQGYAIFIEAKNVAGRPFHFWVLNEDEKSSALSIYLSKNTKNSYVLAPMEENGLGYSFHFDNISVGRERTENTLEKLSVYPIPYRFITGLNIRSDYTPNIPSGITIQNVSHPNESLYLVDVEGESGTIGLAQSYDPGWKAYYTSGFGPLNRLFPFIFGKKLDHHVELNSWENGWIVDKPKSEKIIILYLPQYLEFAGFTLLLLTIIYTLISAIRPQKKQEII